MLGAGVCVCVCVCVCVSHSVVSDSLQHHGLYLTRLLCQWNSPGENTGVGCHSLLQGIFPTRDRTRVSHIVSRFFTIWTVDPYKLLICVLISNQYLSTSDHGENYFNPATGVVGIRNKDSLCIWKEKLSLSSTFHLEKQLIRLGKVGTPLTFPLPGASCPRLTQRGHSLEWPHRGWRLMSKY